MLNLLHKVTSIGVVESLSSKEYKRIRLLNIFCFLAIISCILIITYSLVSHQYDHAAPFWIVLLLIVLVLFLQHKHHYIFARFSFWFINYSLVTFCTYVLHSNIITEYNFIICSFLILLFFDEKWIYISSIILTLLSFYTTDFWYLHQGVYLDKLPHYESGIGSFFIFIYLAFFHFKQLNEKNEVKLEKEKNKALEQNNTIEHQKKQLEELNSFQSHFLVNLVHEIRTPLTIIQGNHKQLAKELQQEKLKEINQSIYRNSEKIKLLSDNIIDLAKMNVGKFKLNLKPSIPSIFCRQLTSSFYPLFAQKKIQLSFIDNTIEYELQFQIDLVYFERALSNLILNAYKYTPDHGQVHLYLTKTTDFLVIEVKDDGYGISEEDLPFIFDSFYRANNATNEAGGSGIGLSFSKEVIQLHGGSISVESTLGKGSNFKINIPFTLGNKNTSTNEPKPIATSGNKSILLVEDNPDMRQYIRSILTEYTVKEASNGIEALNMLKSYTPDLIITDYMMPEMNGLDFIQKTKQNGMDKPVIVLTARADDEGKLKFLRLGIDDYLTKPFNEDELLIRIENSITNYTERNQFTQQEEIVLPVENDEIHHIESIIKKHLHSSQFGVPDLSVILAISERSLYRKIKSITGLTPNAFIRELKLLEAQKMCNNKFVKTIKELAESLGFKNSSHFAGLYEKRFGKKPFY